MRKIIVSQYHERLSHSLQSTVPIYRSTIMHAFKGSIVPAIPLLAYIERIEEYSGCSDECFVLSLVYLSKISAFIDDFQLNDWNVHRLILISVMIAAKFLDDHYVSNRVYGKIGGISLKEVNRLEGVFLRAIKFDLSVDQHIFQGIMNEFVEADSETDTDAESVDDDEISVHESLNDSRTGFTVGKIHESKESRAQISVHAI